MRHRCGIARPTQPIMPDTATLEAVTTVAARMTTRRMRRASTPMVAASSSPMVRMLIFQRMAKRTMQPTAMKGNANPISLIFVYASDPMSQ